jgi:hypothetical protein
MSANAVIEDKVKPLNILQGWAYEVVERVAKRLIVEDDLVEFKSAWIEPHKAARRIAAQANAARGEDFLWLVGIDPRKADPFVEIEAIDPDAWLREVATYFIDNHLPECGCFQVSYNGKSVYAIAFGSSDFPFLISLKKLNQKGGHPEGIAEAELPWRTGTGARSATRQQILSLLYRIPPLPDIEVLGAEFLPSESLLGTIDFGIGFYVKLYVIPRSRDWVIVPLHRVQWVIQLPDGVGHLFNESCEFLAENDDVARRDHVSLGRLLIPEEFQRGYRVTGRTDPNDAIEARVSELVIKGPGAVWFIGNLPANWDNVLQQVETVSGKILLSVGSERTILPVNFEARNLLQLS